MTYVREVGTTCGMKDRHVNGRALRELRLQRQMRQKDLAMRAAVRADHLCRIENDADYCSDMLVIRLARILECRIDDFTSPGAHPNASLWRRSRSERPAAA